VQQEKKDQSSTQSGFKDELTALGDELRSFSFAPTKPLSLDFSIERTNSCASSDNSAALEARMRTLEARFDMLSGEYSGRTSALERDLESSLILSERRVKKLDELYREASAENEALYDRFNTELSKIAKDVRSGNGEDSLKSQLASALDEINRVKKENFRLKREVGGLRAQQAATALVKASDQ
jgi:BMFP domain-containing protein YqiC